jgi:hypothetical protein
MFAAGKTAAVSGAAPDDKFNYVTMLLHGDGTNGAQNNTFIDGSTNNFTITRNGNTTQGSFSPYGSNWSNYFNGSSSTPLNFPDNNGFTFDADFTIEAWVFLSSTSAFQIVTSKWDVGGQEWILAVDSGGVAEFHWAPYSEGGPAIESSSGAVTANQWTHLAAVRSGSTITLYVNGTSVGTRTNGTAGTNRTTLVTVGYLQYLGGDKLTGYVSNLRIVKGTAVYTASFTPSTTPLTAISGTSLLTCQSNRFVDNSASPLTASVNGVTVQRFNPFGTSTAYSTSVIGGSGYFDGNGDNLIAVSANTANAMGTGDWTAEAWIYLTVGGGTPFVFDTLPSGSGSATGLRMRLNASNQLQLWQYGSAVLTSSASVTVNAWTHVALVKNSGTTTAYVNGTASNTYSDSGNYTCGTDRPMIGSDGFNNGSENSFPGYISNLRLVKGTAVYTASFTPNTAPLSAITNTSLLLNTVNAAIFDNAMMNDLETVGNAQISTTVKKYGTGSLAFDGTGDYLTGKSNPIYAIGTANFTVEAWVYPTAFSAYRAVFDTRTTLSNGGMDLGLASSSAGVWGLYKGSAVTVVQSSTNLTLNTWQHIAAVRSGSTVTLYLDGVSVGSATDAQDFTEQGCHVGRTFDNYTWSGYIDDLRVTRGYARYTTTFTPPTAAFPNTGPI